MVQYLILGITFSFAAAVQPGPLQAYLINRALTSGWRKTIIASISPVLSDGPIIILVLFLLSQMPSVIIHLLQIVGGVFLVYLAFGAYKTYKNYGLGNKAEVHSGRQTLFKAAFVNLLNPNPYLSWSLIMGPLLIKGWKENPVNGIALLISFYTTMILLLCILIVVFAKAGSAGAKITRVLIGISAIALCCFGIYQFLTGIKIFY
jgi:threonine/homoserine/homoserine lactone efflux protein